MRHSDEGLKAKASIEAAGANTAVTMTHSEKVTVVTTVVVFKVVIVRKLLKNRYCLGEATSDIVSDLTFNLMLTQFHWAS